MDSTLVGVVIGGLIGLSGTFIGQVMTRNQRRRDLIRERTAMLLQTTYEKFYADQRVHVAVFSLTNVHARPGATQTEISEYEAAERRAKDEYNGHVDAAHNTLAELELLEPRLGSAALKLVEVSQMPVNHDRINYSQEQRDTFVAARANFIQCARRYL